MSSNDEKLLKESIKAAIEVTIENIPNLINKFKNREIAFIKNRDNIDAIIKERNSAEWKTIRQFIPKEEKYLGIQIQMGLTLSTLERKKDNQNALIENIMDRFGRSGLHVAELTQLGIVIEFLTRLMKMYSSSADVTSKFIAFLKQSEDLAIFVKSTDNPDVLVNILKIRLEAISSHTILMFGRGKALGITKKIIKKLKDDQRGYVIETQGNGKQIVAFIYTPEIKAFSDHWSECFTD